MSKDENPVDGSDRLTVAELAARGHRSLTAADRAILSIPDLEALIYSQVEKQGVAITADGKIDPVDFARVSWEFYSAFPPKGE